MITDELLFRFLNGEASGKENRLVNDWLSRFPDQAKRLDHLNGIFESTESPDSVKDRIYDWDAIESILSAKQTDLRTLSSLPVRLARIAAVILVLISSGLLWLYQSNTHILRNKDVYAKSVLLPDGTEINLGPGSKLVYGREFMNGIRVIRLTGEAYFDVTSDPDHPFTVIAGLAKIKVTGTRFFVNASPSSQEVEVSVKSGKVLFYNSDTMNKNSFRMGLAAGEKGIFYPALNRMDKTIDPYFRSKP